MTLTHLSPQIPSRQHRAVPSLSTLSINRKFSPQPLGTTPRSFEHCYRRTSSSTGHPVPYSAGSFTGSIQVRVKAHQRAIGLGSSVRQNVPEGFRGLGGWEMLGLGQLSAQSSISKRSLISTSYPPSQRWSVCYYLTDLATHLTGNTRRSGIPASVKDQASKSSVLVPPPLVGWQM